MDAEVRQRVRQRSGYLCEYCRQSQSESFYAFHIEHIIAKQHGGSDDLENLCLACPDCNFAKGPNLAGIDPDTATVVALFHPRSDKWADHFCIDDGRIIGLTATGRTTAWLLRMNDAERVHQRQLIAGRNGNTESPF